MERSEERSKLMDAAQELLWTLKMYADAASPVGVLTARRALRGVLSLLKPGDNEWEQKALEDYEAAIEVLTQKYEVNLARDLRVIPH